MGAPFVWHVFPGGYRWVPAVEVVGVRADWGADERLIVPRADAVTATYRATTYAPLDEYAYAALFRTFAHTDPTPDGVLAFASRYGLLGLEAQVQVPLWEGGGDDRPEWERWTVGEPCSAWREEIMAMQDAVATWELLSAGDLIPLRRYLREHPTPPGISPYGYGSPEPLEGEGKRVRPGSRDADDPEWAALSRLEVVVTKRLSGRASPRLNRTLRGAAAGVALEWLPTSLIGALWVQLAEAMSRQKGYRRCATCGDWFAIGPESRADRQHCSNACRSKAYRLRHRTPA
jgi:hypothetical protein